MGTAIRSIGSDESIGGWLPPSGYTDRRAEDGAPKREIARLKRELENAKEPLARSESDALMHSAIDALLRQAKELSTLICEHRRQRRDLR